MKRRNFIIALIAFAAVTAAVGSAVASLSRKDVVATDVWVRVNANSSANLKFAGTYDITPGANQVIVSVNDTRTPGADTRIGYAADGTTVLFTSSTSAIPSTVTLP